TCLEAERRGIGPQSLRYRRRRLAAKTEVQHRHVKAAAIHQRQCLPYRATKANDIRARFEKDRLELHQKQRLVLDDKDASTLQLKGSVVPYCCLLRHRIAGPAALLW